MSAHDPDEIARLVKATRTLRRHWQRRYGTLAGIALLSAQHKADHMKETNREPEPRERRQEPTK